MTKSGCRISNSSNRLQLLPRPNGQSWFGFWTTWPNRDRLATTKNPNFFGGLRLLWFYDAGNVVICANGYMKQGQKTPNAEIETAIQWKNNYLHAKETGKLKDITPK